MINVYSDKAFLPEHFPHAPMLFPFWGFLPAFGDLTLDVRRFEHYLDKGADLFRLTSLEDARFAVLPFEWDQIDQYEPYQTAKGFGASPDGLARAMSLADEFSALAAIKGKRTVVFFSQDNIAEVPLDNSIVFRTSMIAASRRPNEYALPYWMMDEIEGSFGGELPIREKGQRAVIGFCGQSPVNLDARTKLNHKLCTVPGLRGVAYRLGVRPGANYSFYPRAQALEALSRSRDVRANFIMRQSWFNGAFTIGGVVRSTFERSRKEYVENMFGSDYILCARGNGNYSIRFFETLSCGRIPVFINTDCVLPFEEWIDWKQHCVWIEERDVPHIAEKVAEFHESLSPGEFRDRQYECRRLWTEWLSPYGFFKNLHRYFQ